MKSIHEYSSDELRSLIRLLESNEATTLFFPMLRREEEAAIEDVLDGLSDGTEAGAALARYACGKVKSLRHIASIHDTAIELLGENEK